MQHIMAYGLTAQYRCYSQSLYLLFESTSFGPPCRSRLEILQEGFVLGGNVAIASRPSSLPSIMGRQRATFFVYRAEAFAIDFAGFQFIAQSLLLGNSQVRALHTNQLRALVVFVMLQHLYIEAL